MRWLALAALLVLAAGCTAPKKDEGSPRAVRFAVIAAPEIGQDDGDLLLAVTKLSREKDLAFVLVPGPLLAKDADKTSLELLRNALGQIAPPVYVAFASVTSGARTGKDSFTTDDVLTALEGMGPGREHAISYNRSPPRGQGVVVDVVAPDGKSSLKVPPTETKRVIGLTATTSSLRSDINVLVSRGVLLHTIGSVVLLEVPPLSESRCFVVANLWPQRLEVEVVALEGPPPPQPESMVLPPPREPEPP